jgi:hypothetical protein
MAVRREMAEWRATHVTCEPCTCLSHFSRQSRPSRLSQGSAIAAEALMNNAGQVGISEGFRLAKSESAVPGGAGAKGSATMPHPLF